MSHLRPNFKNILKGHGRCSELALQEHYDVAVVFIDLFRA